MASRQTIKEPVECWNILARVLSYGHTIPFSYNKGGVQRFYLTEGKGWGSYTDDSCAEYILDDIQFALFDQACDRIQLHLSGICDGPITDCWTFTFTKDGLVEAYNFYNDD